MSQGNLVSRIPEHSILSSRVLSFEQNPSASDFGMSRRSSLLPTKRLEMQRNLTSNIAITPDSNNIKIMYVYAAEVLKSPQLEGFHEILQNEYKLHLVFETFKSATDLMRIKFHKQPISCIIVDSTQLAWAKKFSANLSNKLNNLVIYIYCRNTEQLNKILELNQDKLRPASSFEDIQTNIKSLYQAYSEKYVHQVTEKRIRNKFYYKSKNNQVLNIYYEEKLRKIVEPYVNSISGNKKFKKTNFFCFKDMRELIKWTKNRKTFKRGFTRHITQSIISGSSVELSTAGLVPTGSLNSLGDLMKVTEAADINYFLVSGSHPQLKQIEAYCLSDKNTHMLILKNESDMNAMQHQMRMFASESDQYTQKDRLIMSEKLIVMVHHEDEATRRELEEQENLNFHAQVVLIWSPEQLARELWRVHQNQNYYGLIIMFEDRFEEFSDAVNLLMYGSSDNDILKVDNIKVVLKRSRSNPDDSVDYSYVSVQNSKAYIVRPEVLAEIDSDYTFVQQIYRARNTFYHPAQGIIGTKVFLFIRKSRTALIEYLSTEIMLNKRLELETYEDKQQLQYLISKTHKSQCALIVTHQKELIQVMKCIKNQQNIYLLLVSPNEKLSYDPQILKTGTEQDINNFIKQIPSNEYGATWEDQSYDESLADPKEGVAATSLTTIQEQALKRMDDDKPRKIFFLPGRKIVTVRIPNDQDSHNSIIFENRIKNKLGDDVNFKTYRTSQEIRDMDKWEEPLQFLIVNDTYLEWTKKMAEQELNQPFEIIYYTRKKLGPFFELISNPKYKRFKLIANKWKNIEDYIIGKFKKLTNQKDIYQLLSNQKLDIILTKHDVGLQRELDDYAYNYNNQIAKRCRFSFYDQNNEGSLLREVSRLAEQSSLAFLIVNEDKQKALDEYSAGKFIYSLSDTIRQIVISSLDLNSRNRPHEKTEVITCDEVQAAKYIASIRLVQVYDEKFKPTILAESTDLQWRYFLKRNAVLHNKFIFGEFKRQSELIAKIHNLRRQNPNQMIWILLSNLTKYQKYKEKLATQNVKFVVCDPSFPQIIQNNDLLFASSDPQEVKAYILNFTKKSKTIIPQSALPQIQGIKNGITFIYDNNLPIRKECQLVWTQRFNTSFEAYSTYEQMLALLKRAFNDRKFVYLVSTREHNSQLEQNSSMRQSQYKNLRKILMNFDTKSPSSKQFQKPEVVFNGDFLVDQNIFIRNLGYTLRNSRLSISRRHFCGQHPIIDVFVKEGIFNKDNLRKNQKYNQSFKLHYYLRSEDLINSIQTISSSNAIVIVGNEELVQQIPNSPNIRFIVYGANRKFDSDNRVILETNDPNQAQLFFRNLPDNRLKAAQKLRKPGIIFIKNDVDSLNYLRKKAEEASSRNPGLSVQGYAYLNQLENHLAKLSKNEMAIIMMDKVGIDQEREVEEMINKVKSSDPNKIIKIILHSNRGRRPKEESGNKLFVSDSENLIEDFMENIPYNLAVAEPSSSEKDFSIKIHPGEQKTQNNLNMSSDKSSQFSPRHESEKNIIIEFKKTAQFTNNSNPLGPLNFNIDRNLIDRGNMGFGLFEYNSLPQNFEYLSINDDSQPLKKPCISDNSAKSTYKQKTQNTKSTNKSIKESQEIWKLALIYWDDPFLQNTLRYIKKNTPPHVRFTNFKISSITEAHELLQKEYRSFDKFCVLLAPYQLNHYIKISGLQKKYRRLRVFLLLDPTTLTEMSIIMNLGWQRSQLTFPYRNPDLPVELVNADNYNIFVQPRYLKHKVPIPEAQIIRYENAEDLKEGLRNSNQPSSFNIVIADKQVSESLRDIPYLYPKTRFMILGPAVSERQFFDSSGDQFWIFSASKEKSIQDQLSRLLGTVIPKLRKETPEVYDPVSKVLYLTPEQKAYIYHPELIDYQKIIVDSNRDLKKEVKNLLSNQHGFTLNTQNPDKIRIQSLVKDKYTLQRNTQKIIPAREQDHQSYQIAQDIYGYSQKTDTKSPFQRSQIKGNGLIVESKVRSSNHLSFLPFDKTSRNQALIRMFDQNSFQKCRSINFYYLGTTNAIKNLQGIKHLRSGYELAEEFKINQDCMLVVFSQKDMSTSIPEEVLLNQKIKVFLVSPYYYEGYLSVQFDQIPDILDLIRKKKAAMQLYCIFAQSDIIAPNTQKLIAQRVRDGGMKFEFGSLEHFKQMIQEYRYQISKADIYCFQNKKNQIKKILQAYTVPNYTIHTLPPTEEFQKPRKTKRNQNVLNNNQIEYDLVEIDVKDPVQSKIASLDAILAKGPSRHFVCQTKNKQLINILLASPGNLHILSSKEASQKVYELREKPLLYFAQGDEFIPDSIQHENAYVIYLTNQKERSRLPQNLKMINSWSEVKALLDSHEAGYRLQKLSDFQNVRIIYDESISRKDKIRLLMLKDENRQVIPLYIADWSELESIVKRTPKTLFILMVGPEQASRFRYLQKSSSNTALIRKGRGLKELYRTKIIPVWNDLDQIIEQENEESELLDNQYKVMSDEALSALLKSIHDPYSLPNKNSKKRGNHDLQDQGSYLKKRRNISDELHRFLPILNGQVMRILLPSEMVDLRDLLSSEFDNLMIVKYSNFGYLDSYLARNAKYPTIVLLRGDLFNKATELCMKYPHIRVISVDSEDQKRDEILCLDHQDVISLIKWMLQENALVEKRLNNELEKIQRPIVRNEDTSLLPVHSYQQKVVLCLSSHRNQFVRQAVDRVCGDKVKFLQYFNPGNLRARLETLDDDEIVLILSNDEQIQEIEQMSARNRKCYFVRHISDHMKPLGYFRANDRLLFTGFTLHDVSNYINNLIYKTYKKLEKRDKSSRSRSRPLRSLGSARSLKSLSEQKKYRRKYIPSTFGTAPRFEYFDDQYVPTERIMSPRETGTNDQKYLNGLVDLQKPNRILLKKTQQAKRNKQFEDYGY